MDPTATFDAMIVALLEGNRFDFEEHADNLFSWLNRGGFHPEQIRILDEAMHNSHYLK